MSCEMSVLVYQIYGLRNEQVLIYQFSKSLSHELKIYIGIGILMFCMRDYALNLEDL